MTTFVGAFDSRIQVGSAGLQAIVERESEKPREVELVIGIISAVPAGPKGELAPIPLGNLRWVLDKPTLKGLAEEFQKAVEQMQDPKPHVEVARSLAGVDSALGEQKKFRG